MQYFPIFIYIFSFQIVQQTTALTNKLEQPLSGVMVLLVNLKMLGQVLNTLGKQGDLYLGRPGVSGMGLKFLNYFIFRSS